MVKSIYNYIYYRVCKFYSKFTEDYAFYASSAVTAALGLIFTSISAIILPIFKFELTDTYLYGVGATCVILTLINTNKRKYIELKELYKNERYASLKGWLVAGFMVGSLICGFIFIRNW